MTFTELNFSVLPFELTDQEMESRSGLESNSDSLNLCFGGIYGQESASEGFRK